MGKKRLGLKDYGFKESTTFKGLMPIIAKKVGSIGYSPVNVSTFDKVADGTDSLEVVDLSLAYTPLTDGDFSSLDFNNDFLIEYRID